MKFFAAFLVIALAYGGFRTFRSHNAGSSVAAETTVARARAEIKTSTVEIPNVDLDKPYPAMEGPIRNVRVPVELGGRGKAVWLLGVKTEIFENGRPAPEYLCHARLGSVRADFDISKMRTINTDDGTQTRFLFPLSQGHTEMNLPRGLAVREMVPPNVRDIVFGIQFKSPTLKKPTKVSARVTVTYVDGPTGKQMGLRPLSITRLAFEPGQYSDVPPPPKNAGPHHHHAGGEGTISVDDYLLFWAPPGKHRYTTLVEPKLNQPRAKAHYIYTHLHAYASHFEIVDGKTGESLWTSKLKTDRKHATLESMDHYVSLSGIPIFNDRKYKLIVEYDNPKKKPIDAMAIATIYYE